MKFVVKNLSVNLAFSDVPFNYFVYIPDAPKFDDADLEEAWVERAKRYIYNKVESDARLKSGNAHVLHLPNALLEQDVSFETDSELSVPFDYDNGWCAFVHHTVPDSPAVINVLQQHAVPDHRTCILIPDVYRILREPQNTMPDLVEVVMIRFIFLIFALFFSLMLFKLIVG